MAIQFLNTVAVDTDVLYVDTANNRVGIGEPNPDYELHVDGQIYSKSSTFPVYFLQRETSITGDGTFTTTSGIASGFHLRTNSSGTIQDGFGGGVVFSLTDSGTASNTAARIYARRDGGNTTGALQFWGGLDGNTILTTMRANGNVGIGTASPNGLLHISSGTSGDAIVVIESDTDDSDNSDNPHLEFRQDGNTIRGKIGLEGVAGQTFSNSLSNATYLGSVFEQSLQFITGNTGGVQTAKMTIQPNTGNVGIGTTSPVGKLNVALDGNSGGNVSAWSSNQVVFTRGGTSTSQGLGFSVHEGSNFNTISSLTPSVTWSDLAFRALNHSFYGNGSILSMYINSSGNVGIGTTSPGSKLEISSVQPRIMLKDTTTGVSSGYTTSAIDFYTSDTSSEGSAVNAKIESYASDIYGRLGLRFFTGGGGAPTQAMTVDWQGNVGIGTSSPTADLSVGSISTSSGDVHLRTTKTAFAITPSNTDAGGVLLDLGWVSGGQGPMKFGIGSAEKMRINSSGNVGIGTTSPGSKLHIQALQTFNGGSGGYLKVTDAIYGGDVRFGMADGVDNDAVLGVWTNNNVNIYTNSSERMRIDSSGNVGINCTPSGNKFQVNQSADQQGISLGMSIRGSSKVDWEMSGANNDGHAFLHDNGTNRYLMWYSTRSRQSFYTEATERLRIDSSGNVGIGTYGLAARLQVSSDGLGQNINDTTTQAIFNSSNVNQSNLYIQDYRTAAGNDWTFSGKRIQEKIDSTWMGYMQFNGTGNNGGISFGTGTSTTQSSIAERMRITPSGNVGIGTTNPSEKLHIEAEFPRLKMLSTLLYGTPSISMGNGVANETATITCSNNPAESFLQLKYDNGATGDSAIRLGQRNLDFMIDSGTAIHIDSNKFVGIGVTNPQSKLQVNGGVQIGDDTFPAYLPSKAGTLRYRTSGNNSYVDMHMQTGASTYAWVNIVTNSW